MRFLTEPQTHLIKIIESYISVHSTEEREFLKQCYEETYAKIKDPQFIAGHIQGNFLSMISRMIRPKRVLELGTFTGYSAVCFADGLDENGIVHTIDNNELLYEIAEKYIGLSDNANKIIFHKGNAFDVIPTLNEVFDLVYIDADKVESSDYYDIVFDKIRKGGFIVCDNALWYGRVLDNNKDDDTLGLHLLNEKIQNDKRVFNVLVSIRDGIMLAQKLI
jgi:caffeoyl-CoA O-methyltransferase